MLLKILIIFVVVIFAFVSCNLIDNNLADNDVAEWKTFIKHHGKQYKDEAEHKTRHGHFMKNSKKVKEHNKLYKTGKVQWQMATYSTSDLSDEEFMKYHCGTSPKFAPNSAEMHEIIKTPIEVPQSRASPPTTWDIRTMGPGKLGVVKDQQLCGACWAFAVAATLENAYSKKTGKSVILSEQQQMDCNTNCNSCAGGWLTYAYDYTQAKGVSLNSSYPYVAATSTCKPNVPIEVKNSYYIQMASDIGNIQSFIRTFGACAMCVDASKWNTYANGTFTGAGASPNCNHAVTLIGYGPGYWLIRNSWGPTWGMQGHIQIQNTLIDGGAFNNLIFCPMM